VGAYADVVRYDKICNEPADYLLSETTYWCIIECGEGHMALNGVVRYRTRATGEIHFEQGVNGGYPAYLGYTRAGYNTTNFYDIADKDVEITLFCTPR
jgi:hypothetical protein